MNPTTPAIVAQGAVRRLPRAALLLFCVAYVLPGFVGRAPWKHGEMSAFGYMAELARGATSWFSPQLMGLKPEVDALLPYWLGAWAMKMTPDWVPGDLAVRVPFALMLAIVLIATWYGTYYLARSPQAQPVAFAFGGEASLPDYARAMADGGLLAFIACLGLAQLSHETTPALVQLCFTALFFFAVAALPYRVWVPRLCAVVGLTGLALSGGPTVAMLLGIGSALIYWLDQSAEPQAGLPSKDLAIGLAVLTLGVMLMASLLGLWRWQIELPRAQWVEWRSLGRLFLWFTWPAWPLVLWTLWRWRHHVLHRNGPSRHIALPLWFAMLIAGTTLTTASADRSLLLALPALAALAAFALPTLGRSVAALIDWFTLIFFSGCALVIWVVWISLQTGVPTQPAANVARLAPGFEHSFSLVSFLIATAATLAWAWLVKWRVGRHRAAIWKSLVLPASGTALCWMLLMTLWLPMLDFARSYAPQVRRVVAVLPPGSCIEVMSLSRGQIAALQFHGNLALQAVDSKPGCPLLLVGRTGAASWSSAIDLTRWSLYSTVRRPYDADEDLKIYIREAQTPR